MILSLDPSFRAFGWALIDETNNTVLKCGKISVDKNATKTIYKSKILTNYMNDQVMIKKITITLNQLIKENNIKLIYTEIPIGSRSARAAECLAMVKSLVVGVATLNNCFINPLAPGTIKSNLTKNSQATKEEIYQEVIKKLPSLAGFFVQKVSKDTKYAISDAVAAYASTF